MHHMCCFTPETHHHQPGDSRTWHTYIFNLSFTSVLGTIFRLSMHIGKKCWVCKRAISAMVLLELRKSRHRSTDTWAPHSDITDGIRCVNFIETFTPNYSSQYIPVVSVISGRNVNSDWSQDITWYCAWCMRTPVVRAHAIPSGIVGNLSSGPHRVLCLTSN